MLLATTKQRFAQLLRLRFLWRLALLASIAAILFLATTAGPLPVPSAPSDKVNHLIAFLELTLLVRLGWPQLKPLHFIPLLLGFGMLIEIVQATLPYRDFSLADVAADAAGIAAGMLIWPWLKKFSSQY
ncbi:MAG TPA: VanZ family protein [Marinobacter sp.]|nr:VanZ family protein [Marinobacter sp.]